MNRAGSANASFVPGTMVQLPIPSDFVRSLASLKSLDLIDPTYPKRMRHRRMRSGKRRRSSARSVMMETRSSDRKRL
jgi:hypothetical protein